MQESLPSPPPKGKSTGLWVVASVLIVIAVASNLLHAFCLGIIPWPFKPGGEEPRGGVTITSGDAIEVTSQSIDYHGGTIEVTDSLSPLDGLRIDVPEGATDELVTFTVSYSEIIEVAGLPENVSVASKLINIETSGSETWNKYKTFDIPLMVTLPYDPSLVSDEDVVRFYSYDEENRVLDSAGFLFEDPMNHTITFLASSFSYWTAIRAYIEAVIRFVKGLPFETDFKPNPDGWFIPNYGSYLYPGNCMGMCCYAKWYYTYKKQQTGVSLYNKYLEGDTEEERREWRDDATAIQLATRAQLYTKEFGWGYFPWHAIANAYCVSDAQSMAATLCQGMLVDKAPQLLRLDSWVGGFWIGDMYVPFPGRRLGEGHMVLVYGYRNEGFLVYDPNSPGAERTIGFTWEKGFTESYEISMGETIRLYNFFVATGTKTYYDPSHFSGLYDAAEKKFKDDTLFPTVKLTDTSTTPEGTTPIDTDADGVRDTSEREVKISGTITGGKREIEHTLFLINGRKPVKIPVEAGGFSSQQVPLRQGDNDIIILATDEDTRSDWAGYLRTVIKCTASKAALAFTLDWEQYDCDLDLHVLEPTIDGVPGRHIYYRNRGGYEEGEYPYLDIDNTWGYGPEHYYAAENMTLPNHEDGKSLYGTYKVRVHYYADHDDDEENTQLVFWHLRLDYLAFEDETKTPPKEYWEEEDWFGYLAVANSAGTENFDNTDASWDEIFIVEYPEPDPAEYELPPPPQNKLYD